MIGDLPGATQYAEQSVQFTPENPRGGSCSPTSTRSRESQKTPRRLTGAPPHSPPSVRRTGQRRPNA